jgi:anti-sigma regulatory factor (Ser/Thr protein kinase)
MPIEPFHRTLRITNETKNLSLVRQAVSEVLARTPFAQKERNSIILAVDEAVANVVEHAYQGNRGEIDLVFELDGVRLEITIRDNGVKFDPGHVPAPDIHEYIRTGKKGGFGMVLMRKIMDEVRYSRDTNYMNELVMVKFYPTSGEAPRA